MTFKHWLTIASLACLFALPPALRGDDDSKVDKLRAEAKKLLKAADEIDREHKDGDKDDDDREVKKPKVEKQPAVKKEGGDKKEGEKKQPAPELKKPAPEPKKPAPEFKKEPAPEFKKGLAPEFKKMALPEPKKGPGPEFVKKPMPEMHKGDKGPGPGPMKGPHGGEFEERLMHMMTAAKHLRAAGMNEPAENIERMAGEMKRQMAQQHAMHGGPDGDLRREVMELRRAVEEMRAFIKQMHGEGGKR